jgi:hypothetical protein
MRHASLWYELPSCCVEIEDFSALEPHLPGRNRDSMTPDRNVAVQFGRVRSTGGGARLFLW